MSRIGGGDVAESRLRATRTSALLSRLAFPVPGAVYRREALGELLWPGASPQVARRRLRQTFYELTEIVGSPEAFEADIDGIRIVQNLWDVDTAAFTESLKAADAAVWARDVAARLTSLARAAEIYRGDLLPDFDELWIGDERDRIRTAFLDALKALALCAEEHRAEVTALAAARRLIVEEPNDEEASLLLLRLLAAANQGIAARREYERFRKSARRATMSLSVEFRRQARKLMLEAGAVAELRETSPEQRSPIETIAPRVINLPDPLSSFFGRNEEIASITALLSDPNIRLVTLTGPAGLGKTRLAIETIIRSRRAADFIEMAALAAGTGTTAIAAWIAAALNLQTPIDLLGNETEALDSIARDIAARPPAILVLDNLEHLQISGAANAVTLRLLAAAPNIRILVTSRLALGIPGEAVVRVSTLPVGNFGKSDESSLDASDSPAVALFLDRVGAVRPDFKATRDNSAAIRALCQRLDGLPLALEIAAGWARAMTPSEMLHRLNRRFAFLVRRAAAPTDRHRTLEAALTWSYEMLPTETSFFFRQLGVFQGGFSASAAAAVTAFESDAAATHLDILCERNLIVAESLSDNVPEMRFTMLESLRDFALERQTSEEHVDAERRHAIFYTELAWAGDDGLKGPEQNIWWDRLAREIPNLRATFARPDRTSDDAIRRARLCASLALFWNIENVPEAARWMEAALTIPELPTALRAQLLTVRAGLDNAFGNKVRAWTDYTEALRQFRSVGDEGGEAHLLAHWSDNPDALAEAVTLCSRPGRERLLGIAKTFQASLAASHGSRDGVLQGFAEARRLFQECRDTMGIQGTLQEEAHHRSRWGEIEIAAELLEDHLRLTLGARRRQNGAFTIRFRLANLRRLQGFYERASELLELAERQIREVGWPGVLADVLLHRIRLHCDLGETNAARTCLNEWLDLQTMLSPGENRGPGITLNAQITLAEGNGLGAARLAGDALRAFGDNPHGGWRAVAGICRAQAALRTDNLAGAERASRDALHDSATVGDRLIFVRAVEVCGQVSARSGAASDAAFVLGFAEAEREVMSIVIPPLVARDHEAAVSAIRDSLSSEMFESAWTDGRSATTAEVMLTAQSVRRIIDVP